MKGKCIAMIQKQIIMKIIIWLYESLTGHKSEKTLMKWFLGVLAWIRFVDSHKISEPATKHCMKKQKSVVLHRFIAQNNQICVIKI